MSERRIMVLQDDDKGLEMDLWSTSCGDLVLRNGNGPGKWTITAETILEFVADEVRKRRVDALEEMTTDKILGI